MANSAAVLLGAVLLASSALPAAAHGPMLGSQVMDVRAGDYRDAPEADDGYAERAREAWSYAHAGYADRGSTVTSYREHHSYHSATYLGWDGKAVVDEGGYDAGDDRYGGGAVEDERMAGGPGCPRAMEGERVIRCRYIPLEQQAAPVSDEVGALDLYTDGGVGGFVSGGGGGGVFIEGSGMSGVFSRSSAASRAYASSSASASASASVAVSIQSQMHGGGHGGGWSSGGGGWSSGHSSGGGGRW